MLWGPSEEDDDDDEVESKDARSILSRSLSDGLIVERFRSQLGLNAMYVFSFGGWRRPAQLLTAAPTRKHR